MTPDRTPVPPHPPPPPRALHPLCTIRSTSSYWYGLGHAGTEQPRVQSWFWGGRGGHSGTPTPPPPPCQHLPHPPPSVPTVAPVSLWLHLLNLRCRSSNPPKPGATRPRSDPSRGGFDLPEIAGKEPERARCPRERAASLPIPERGCGAASPAPGSALSSEKMNALPPFPDSVSPTAGVWGWGARLGNDGKGRGDPSVTRMGKGENKNIQKYPPCPPCAPHRTPPRFFPVLPVLLECPADASAHRGGQGHQRTVALGTESRQELAAASA